MNRRAREWRRSLLIGAGVSAVLVLLGVTGHLTSDVREPAPEPERVLLAGVPGGTAAVSTRHGPRVVSGGRAGGFSHDELGAALAASNLLPRISKAAGRDVATQTLLQQCWGDTTAATAEFARVPSAPTAGMSPELVPAALYFRVLAGDPAGEVVTVSLLADTPQARELGGLSRVDATLRWSGLDWQLRVPVARPSLQPDTTGYQLLGPTP